MKTVALVAFITVYALLLLLPKGRWIAPVAAAALFVGVGIVPAGMKKSETPPQQKCPAKVSLLSGTARAKRP